MKKALFFVFFLSVWNLGAQTQPHGSAELMALEKQYRLAKDNGDAKRISETALQAGEAYLGSKNYKRSIDFLLVAKEFHKTIKDTKGLAKVSCRLAENYYKTSNNKRYKDYIALAQQLIGNDTLSAEYLLLLDTQIGYFQSKKKNPQAQFLIARKAQLQSASTGKLPKVQTPAVAKPSAFPTVKKPAPERVRHGISKQTPIHDLLLVSCVTMIALLAGGLIYYFYRDRRRKLRQRSEFNDRQSQLFENLSKCVKAQHVSNEILADQLQQLSEITGKTRQPAFKMEPIGALLQDIVKPFADQAEKQSIAVISNIETSLEKHWVDKEALKTIVALLWTEAFRHTQNNDSLYFSAIVDPLQLDLRISYPCQSVTKEQLPHLFESLFNADTEDYPNPIGFALLGSLVSWYQGKVEATLDGNLLRITAKLPLSEIRKYPKTTPGLVL